MQHRLIGVTPTKGIGPVVTFYDVTHNHRRIKNTNVWLVAAPRLPEPLGEVRWYTRWRSYAFIPAPGTVFEEKALAEIAKFCKDHTASHWSRYRTDKVGMPPICFV